MNGLLRHSNLSFTSSRPPSIISLPTTTSTDTIEGGIGTLSARAVYAVGEAALRGLENLAIRRKLRVINSAFPHDNAVALKNIDSTYDDVLELSRPGLYRLQVRKQALRVVIIQIGNRQIDLLLQSLAKWPTVEVALFLSEIMACMPTEWLPPNTVSSNMHTELIQAYASCINTTYQHPASPIIDFITELMQINYQAVLDSGFLDVLLCMYVSGFSSGDSWFVSLKRPGHSGILEPCSAALEMLCKPIDAMEVFSSHPICVLWPKNRVLLFLFGRRLKERHLQWRAMDTVVVARRLAAAQPELEQLSLSTGRSNFSRLMDLCIDIVEFSRESLYGPDIAQDALSLIHRCIQLRGVCGDALSKALENVSEVDNRDIFSRLISHVAPPYQGKLHESTSVQFSVEITKALTLHRDGYYIYREGRGLIATPMTLVATLPRVQAECDIIQGCIGHTREEVLHQVMEWVDNADDSCPRIFWLHGMAGEGKSTITASVIKWMDQSRHSFGASFCFDRQPTDRDCANLLCSTIAHQLSKRFPIIAQYIEEVLKEYPGIATAPVHTQFTGLLLRPLESIAWAFQPSEYLVLVLDGLDKSGSEKTRLALRSIFRRFNQLPAFVKVFAASRPERDLRGLFNSMGSQVVQCDLGDIPSALVDCDINVFIEERMSAIVGARKESCDVHWPNEFTCKAMVQRSGSSFLWASRAMDFVHYDDSSRLDALMDGVGAWETNIEFRGLEDVYVDVLEEAYPDGASETSLRQFRDIVGMIITLKQVSSPDALGLLHMNTSAAVDDVISRLPSIMSITGPNHDVPGTVRIIHPSFADFLSSVRCPSRFAIDVKNLHAKWACGSLVRIRQLLKRNICGIEDESTLNADILDLETKLKMIFTDDLRYACRFWAYHVSHAPEDDGEIFELVESFFFHDVRKWVEALSLLGAVDDVDEALELSRAWIISCGNDNGGLATLISDIQRSIYHSKSQLVLRAGYSHSFFTTLPTDNLAFGSSVVQDAALLAPTSVISDMSTHVLLGQESVLADAEISAFERDGCTTEQVSSDILALVATSQGLQTKAAAELLDDISSPTSDDISDTDSFYSAISDSWSLLEAST